MISFRGGVPWLLAGLVLASGCQRDGDTGKKEIVVAFVTNNPENFWTIAEAGTKKAAKEFNVQADFRRPSEGSAEKQQQIIEDLLTRGIDGIAVSPNDAVNFERFLKSKVANRVPLITSDNDVPNADTRRCYIGTHNYRAGRGAGALVQHALPKGGKIAIFVGTLDATNAVERRQGVLDFLAGIEQEEIKAKTANDAENVKFGAYTLVATKTDNSNQEICFKVAQDFLTTHQDVDCLVGLWAYNPPALLRAVKASQLKKKPLIVGFDEDLATLDAIGRGDIVGTVVQDPFNFGYESIKILASLARKKDDLLKTYPGITANRSIFIPHRLVTKESLELPIDGKKLRTLESSKFEKELKEVLGSK